MSEPLDLDAIQARADASDADPWPIIDDDIPALIACVRELTPRVLEGDWETVRDALDALPEGAQIRWVTGIVEHVALAIRRGKYWAITGYSGPLTSESIARDETPIEVIA
ncbi:hypothetical protein [Rhodococcus sp. 15-649-2-2]|uniref:hypothetical protein n=1 Tax=Rhodococcus sp. 15-649-2-2 TaxID=2023140 RepID=UPI001179DFB7|nr:hypothetical protein [Rhodococcus sp. 15-649-2-2]